MALFSRRPLEFADGPVPDFNTRWASVDAGPPAKSLLVSSSAKRYLRESSQWEAIRHDLESDEKPWVSCDAKFVEGNGRGGFRGTLLATDRQLFLCSPTVNHAVPLDHVIDMGVDRSIGEDCLGITVIVYDEWAVPAPMQILLRPDREQITDFWPTLDWLVEHVASASRGVDAIDDRPYSFTDHPAPDFMTRWTATGAPNPTLMEEQRDWLWVDHRIEAGEKRWTRCAVEFVADNGQTFAHGFVFLTDRRLFVRPRNQIFVYPLIAVMEIGDSEHADMCMDLKVIASEGTRGIETMRYTVRLNRDQATEFWPTFRWLVDCAHNSGQRRG